MGDSMERLVDACRDLSYKDREEALQNILQALSWVLDDSGYHQEAILVSGAKTSLWRSVPSAEFLVRIMTLTNTINEDECYDWANRSKRAHEKIKDLLAVRDEDEDIRKIFDLLIDLE